MGSDRVAPLSVDNLIAFNDEIAALVRSGTPLERGLLQAGADYPGRLGDIARAVGARMQQGESLVEALDRLGPAVPETYRAVVKAGVRAGRLPAALEGLASYAREHAELRRTLERAAIYPLIVLACAYGLALLFMVALLPRIRGAFESFGIPVPAAARWLESAGQSARYWGPVLPIILVGLIVAWYWFAKRRGIDPSSPLEAVPKVGEILSLARRANFEGWLAILLEQGVPLPESLELAAAAASDRRLQHAADALANAIRTGNSLGTATREAGRALPAWTRHALISGAATGALAESLRYASRLDQTRAIHRSMALRTMLPLFFLVYVGAAAALLYGTVILLPWSSLLKALGQPA